MTSELRIITPLAEQSVLSSHYGNWVQGEVSDISVIR